ncbi:hypothetical protein OSI83_23245, partial [Mycobacterium ulcerans]
VSGGLKDLSVSRTSFNWGVPVPGHPVYPGYLILPGSCHLPFSVAMQFAHRSRLHTVLCDAPSLAPAI